MTATMLKTLNETIAAYTSKNRASKRNGNCYYFKEGKCCAIGRCLTDPEEFATWDCKVDRLPELEKNLKPEYRGFPLAFWEALQYLHDNKHLWDENGLSKIGQQRVDKIKKAFKL